METICGSLTRYSTYIPLNKVQFDNADNHEGTVREQLSWHKQNHM